MKSTVETKFKEKFDINAVAGSEDRNGIKYSREMVIVEIQDLLNWADKNSAYKTQVDILEQACET